MAASPASLPSARAILESAMRVISQMVSVFPIQCRLVVPAERNTMRSVRLAESESRRKRNFRSLGALFLFVLLVLPAWAQQSELRTVRGAVLDKAENPVSSAVVYLKNVRTLAVKTYISDRSGEYRFSGLDPNVDYEVHAESENMTSNTRTVSSFDSRKDIVISLKLDKEKKKT